jgi:hypothetical protein
MRFKYSAIYRSALIGFAIFALAGCAQFQDSFGEITNPDNHPDEYAAISPEVALSQDKPNPSDNSSQRSFTFRGIKVEMNDGEVTQ